MNAKKILQIITAIPLGLAALVLLVASSNAHVTMCMVCAVGYSVGLPMDRYEKTISKITSFFSGGILFYTIYAGTTLLFIEWAVDYDTRYSTGYIFTDSAWIYHTLINVAILVMFVTKKDRMEYVLLGIELFMLGAPIMYLLQKLLGRELWGSEQRVLLYVLIGLVLFIIHRLIGYMDRVFYKKLLVVVRKLMILSLIIYTIILLAIVPIELLSKGDSRELDNGRVKGVIEWSFLD